MAQQTTGEQAGRYSGNSAAVEGLTIFAAVTMMLIGAFHAFDGLTAIFDDNFFVVTQNYTFGIDVTTWGWIHLIGGIIIAIAGFTVLSGAVWARTVGIVLASLSAIANFLFIPYYPVWSLLMIALDIFVIWALAVYGKTAAVR